MVSSVHEMDALYLLGLIPQTLSWTRFPLWIRLRPLWKICEYTIRPLPRTSTLFSGSSLNSESPTIIEEEEAIKYDGKVDMERGQEGGEVEKELPNIN